MASSSTTSWQIDGETMETVADFIFWGSKITADGDCSHEIKTCLFLGGNAVTNLDRMLKSRDITLTTTLRLVKAMFFSQHQGLSNESILCIRWLKYWSCSFSISPSNEYSGLISFRMNWFDILAIQGTLKSLLQHHSSKLLVLQCSAFFIVQLSHPYMTTGKTIALIIQSFGGKVMSLLFNMLSRLDIVFLPRNKHLLISCLQSPSAVILEPKKVKSATVSSFLIYLP